MDVNWSRRALLTGVGTASFVALAGCRALSKERPPEVTVDNQDDEQYRLVVYTVPDANTPNEIPFRATSPGGERRYTSPSELQSGTTYRNVTVTDANSHRSTRVINPTKTLSMAVEGWERGDAIVYLIETADSAFLIELEVMACESAEKTSRISIKNGGKTETSENCP